MTLHATDLIVVLIMLAAAVGVSYALLLVRLRALISDRQLRIADQIGALDDAIRALETRLAEHQPIQGIEAAASSRKPERAAEVMDAQDSPDESEESGEISPEVQAAIAAATVATLGPNAVIRSVEAVPSPWTQQGRVLVQGGHNFRVRR